jgi:Heat induced stress protein YflT
VAHPTLDIVAHVAITRLFASSQTAREAIVALQASGVDPRAISVVTRLPKDAEQLGDTGANDDLEDAALHRGRLAQFVDWLGKVESATVPGFGAILGTGNLWQDVQLAGSGRGSITGALVGCGVPVDEAAELEQAVFSGQVLLVVHGAYDPAIVTRVLQPT